MTRPGLINRPEDLYLFSMTGSVVGQQSWSETIVSGQSSGGGGYIHNGSGHISSPSVNISSSSTEKLRVFLKDDDGSEIEISESNVGFGARNGHRISVVYAGDKTSRSGHLVAIINHNTNSKKIFFDRANWLIKQGDALSGCLMIVFLPIVIPVTISILLFIAFMFLPKATTAQILDFIENNDMLSAVFSVMPFAIGAVTLIFVILRLSLSNRKRQIIRKRIWDAISKKVSELESSQKVTQHA